MREANAIGQTGSQKEEILQENQALKEEIEKLTKLKRSLEAEEKTLKKILNIEEEHKKHGGIIAAGIRKIFGTKVKEQRYKEAVSLDYSKNIGQFRQMIAKSRADHEDLLSKV